MLDCLDREITWGCNQACLAYAVTVISLLRVLPLLGEYL